MADDLGSVLQALKYLTENLKGAADKDPRAPMGVEDFNALLRRTKQAMRASAVQDMKEFPDGTTLVELLGKASILLGYVQAEWADRISRGR